MNSVFYIPEDCILHSDRSENLKSYIALTGWALYQRCDVSPVRYKVGFNIPEDDILQAIQCLCCKSVSLKTEAVWSPNIKSIKKLLWLDFRPG
jgi:hypothetical protein